MKNSKVVIILLVLGFSCNKFEFSPYQANVSTEFNNTTNKNLQLRKGIQLKF